MPLTTQFIPEDCAIKKWSDIEPYFKELEQGNPQTTLGLKRLISHYSDVLKVYEEHEARAEIEAYGNLQKKSAQQQHEKCLVQQPNYELARHTIEKKIVGHHQFSQLRRDPHYKELHRLLSRRVATFREKQVFLEPEIKLIAKRCSEIINAIPLPEGDLTSRDRAERSESWLFLQEKQYEVKDQLDALLGSLVHLRHRQGRRAGYRDFRRFDHYGSKPRHRITDATHLHRVIQQHVVPLADQLVQKHQKRLGLDGKKIYPWDMDYDGQGSPSNEPELEPFGSPQQLLQRAQQVFSEMRQEFSTCLTLMQENDLLDLEDREHKYNTGYTKELEVAGLPFLSMSAGGTHSDLTTFMHESGHAFHIYLTRNQPLIFYRFHGVDMTMAEMVSQSMELISMEHWGAFYKDREQLCIAKRTKLEEFIRFLPWCIIVDKFQHWIYQKPTHSPHERDEYFAQLMKELYYPSVCWEGLERYRKNYWQHLDHIISDPFYYIEYGFALLGALQLYQKYLSNPRHTLHTLVQGMRMGAQKPYQQIWESMGIEKDFSAEKVKDIMHFVMREIEELDRQIGDVSSKKGSH